MKKFVIEVDNARALTVLAVFSCKETAVAFAACHFAQRGGDFYMNRRCLFSDDSSKKAAKQYMFSGLDK